MNEMAQNPETCTGLVGSAKGAGASRWIPTAYLRKVQKLLSFSENVEFSSQESSLKGRKDRQF